MQFYLIAECSYLCRLDKDYLELQLKLLNFLKLNLI